MRTASDSAISTDKQRQCSRSAIRERRRYRETVRVELAGKANRPLTGHGCFEHHLNQSLIKLLKSAEFKLWGILWGPRCNFRALIPHTLSIARAAAHRVQCFHRPPLCLQPDMAVMLQHLPAEMAADCLDGGVRRLCLCQRGNEVVAKIVDPTLHPGLFLCRAPCPFPRSERFTRVHMVGRHNAFLWRACTFEYQFFSREDVVFGFGIRPTSLPLFECFKRSLIQRNDAAFTAFRLCLADLKLGFEKINLVPPRAAQLCIAHPVLQ